MCIVIAIFSFAAHYRYSSYTNVSPTSAISTGSTKSFHSSDISMTTTVSTASIISHTCYSSSTSKTATFSTATFDNSTSRITTTVSQSSLITTSSSGITETKEIYSVKTTMVESQPSSTRFSDSTDSKQTSITTTRDESPSFTTGSLNTTITEQKVSVKTAISVTPSSTTTAILDTMKTEQTVFVAYTVFESPSFTTRGSGMLEPPSFSTDNSVPTEPEEILFILSTIYESLYFTTSILDTTKSGQTSMLTKTSNTSYGSSGIKETEQIFVINTPLKRPSSTIGNPGSESFRSYVEIILGSVLGITFIVIVTIVSFLVGRYIYRHKRHQEQIYILNNISYTVNDGTNIIPINLVYNNDEARNSVDSTGFSTMEEQFSELEHEYEDIYVVPAGDVHGLYAQLGNIVSKTIARETIRFGSRLSSGHFGEVFAGIWGKNTDSVEVAVKTLKDGSCEHERVKFLQEAAIMGQFKHPNVVTMHGVVTDGEPILLVLEILKKGDLKNFLLSMRTENGISSEVDDHELLSYCRQVAAGMVYLSNKGFVHRDLAARNILVSDDKICKIADFGMSRDLADENYYISKGGIIPVKWTAPEALLFKRYSNSSDVWSYGVVMYEIWSLGHHPFEGVSNNEVLHLINEGYRLPPPPGCPRAIYCIMMSCWNHKIEERPDFIEVSTKLSLSNSKLLHWSLEDKADFPEASKLGASLNSAEKLFEDLQQIYKKSVDYYYNLNDV